MIKVKKYIRYLNLPYENTSVMEEQTEETELSNDYSSLSQFSLLRRLGSPTFTHSRISNQILDLGIFPKN